MSRLSCHFIIRQFPQASSLFEVFLVEHICEPPLQVGLLVSELPLKQIVLRLPLVSLRVHHIELDQHLRQL